MHGSRHGNSRPRGAERREGSVRSLFGRLRSPGRAVPSLEELEERLIDALAEDNDRIRRGGE